METKKLTIVKLYEHNIVAEDENGHRCCIDPSLLTRFFELEKTYRVWCTDLDGWDYQIHAIRDSKTGYSLATSSELEFDEDMQAKLYKFGAYYNYVTNKWQIDMRIMRNDKYAKEVKEILPCISLSDDEFDF